MGGVNKGGKRKGKEGKPKERDEKNENCGGREGGGRREKFGNNKGRVIEAISITKDESPDQT